MCSINVTDFSTLNLLYVVVECKCWSYSGEHVRLQISSIRVFYWVILSVRASYSQSCRFSHDLSSPLNKWYLVTANNHIFYYSSWVVCKWSLFRNKIPINMKMMRYNLYSVGLVQIVGSLRPRHAIYMQGVYRKRITLTSYKTNCVLYYTCKSSRVVIIY